MKKLYFLILFLGASVTLFAQPDIADPSAIVLCDQNQEGFEIVDLTQSNNEILGSLDPESHTVTYHLSLADAQEGLNAVDDINYVVSGNTMLFVRVIENSNPDQPATTTLEISLFVLDPVHAPNLIAEDDAPFDNITTFDLSVQDALYTQGIPSIQVSYHISQADADAGTNQVLVNFVNSSNPQPIFARVENEVGCYYTDVFYLVVSPPGDDIVFIPDPALKARILASDPSEPGLGTAQNAQNQNIAVDTNGDGEIQVSEALAVYKFNFNQMGTVQDLTGMRSFLNLTRLEFGINQVQELDVSGLVNLRYLNSSNNLLTSLDLSDLPELEYVAAASNNLTTINLVNLPKLTSLLIWGNEITTADFSVVPSLMTISCSNNNLTSINLSGLTNLKSLTCDHNSLSVIDLSGLTALETVICGFNSNPNIILTDTPSLHTLNCQSGLGQITFWPSTTLTNVDLQSGFFSSIDFSPVPNLTMINLSHNHNLQSVDVSMLSNINTLQVKNTSITTLNVKNGNAEFYINLDETFNLTQICADEFEVEPIQWWSVSSPVVTPYCSFVPGGDYNTITGTVRFDADANGCSASDPVHPFIKVSLDDGSEQAATFTSDAGTYAFYTGPGNFEVVPQLEIPSYFNVIPVASIDFPVVDNSVATQDFCMVPNGVHRDLEVAIAPIVPARPGFPAVYKIVLRNKGTQTMSMPLGLDFYYDPALMTFTSATLTPDSSGAGHLEWNYTDLQPFESRSIEVTMQINAPTHPTNPVEIGNQLNFAAVVETVGGDEMLADNAFEFQQIAVGSYDPNNIICVEGAVVSPVNIGEYLHYIVNFENTGTDYAENVVVKINFDESEFDVNSMQLMDSSDPVYARVTGNQVEYIFQNIMLEIGGHGNILLKIKTQSNLAAGDVVANGADIFFDYNYPIATNVVSTLFQSLKTPGFAEDASVVVYPNPSTGIVNIKAQSQISSVELFDAYGRLLQMKVGELDDATLDVSSRAKGVYYLRIKTADGIKAEKLLRD